MKTSKFEMHLHPERRKKIIDVLQTAGDFDDCVIEFTVEEPSDCDYPDVPDVRMKIITDIHI